MKVQLHAPGTRSHSQLLKNTFLSELDLDSIKEYIDLEMAPNLGQEINNSFLNLNCSYNMRPTNFNYLMLSRLSFALRKKRIQKFVRKKMVEKRAQIKRNLEKLEE